MREGQTGAQVPLWRLLHQRPTQAAAQRPRSWVATVVTLCLGGCGDRSGLGLNWNHNREGFPSPGYGWQHRAPLPFELGGRGGSGRKAPGGPRSSGGRDSARGPQGLTSAAPEKSVCGSINLLLCLIGGIWAVLVFVVFGSLLFWPPGCPAQPLRALLDVTAVRPLGTRACRTRVPTNCYFPGLGSAC